MNSLPKINGTPWVREHLFDADGDPSSELVRVIGGTRDGHFAPARSIHIYPVGHDPNDVYALRRLKIHDETVKALVLVSINDPAAARIYRQHLADEAEQD